ncbi:hypothetical protein GCM10017567_28190 [Amycolatopsis bullii]|uniref:Uncharacterized protein n=1 Tax=Amycolatopsis bullii TaxID=941987 RepID=A0ABQ3KA23_9PSEU|nr:hypothetical protein GCM10017567_28190 [Amycolatopsis bullii]
MSSHWLVLDAQASNSLASGTFGGVEVCGGVVVGGVDGVGDVPDVDDVGPAVAAAFVVSCCFGASEIPATRAPATTTTAAITTTGFRRRGPGLPVSISAGTISGSSLTGPLP